LIPAASKICVRRVISLSQRGREAVSIRQADETDRAASKAREKHVISLRVNGEDRQFDGDPNMPLLWYVRDELGLPGTKYGCGVALCGACTVHVDGTAVRACVTAVSDAEGAEVVTIEGLSPDGNHPVQLAWRELNVPQCGFCQTGQIMQAAGLLAQNKSPSDAEILEAMAGNVCRCGCYERIVAAVRQAATGA
jgi:isoquinoline 1-oxidoreductase alpha subunit